MNVKKAFYAFLNILWYCLNCLKTPLTVFFFFSPKRRKLRRRLRLCLNWNADSLKLTALVRNEVFRTDVVALFPNYPALCRIVQVACTKDAGTGGGGSGGSCPPTSKPWGHCPTPNFHRRTFSLFTIFTTSIKMCFVGVSQKLQSTSFHCPELTDFRTSLIISVL